MLGVGLALIVLGVVLGLFFPVMFVAAVVGLVLVVAFLVGARRRVTGSSGAAPRSVE